jgi:hypothetical protein
MGQDIAGRQVRRARAARGYAETREAAMAAFAKELAAEMSKKRRVYLACKRFYNPKRRHSRIGI